MRGRCTSSSGSQVFAFFNEGYCDALDKGGIDLRSLSVTFTPIIEPCVASQVWPPLSAHHGVQGWHRAVERVSAVAARLLPLPRPSA